MSTSNKDSSNTATAKPTKNEQSLFEEDDDFEEFPAEGIGLLGMACMGLCLEGFN